MSDIRGHYAKGGPYPKIAAALERLAPVGGPVTLDQLAGFDHFHSAGRTATVRMADLLAPGADDVVLDAGCGLGGPARYLADRFGCRVLGVDLTLEFIDVARLLNARTGMGDRVDVRVGDVTALDLDDASVDHIWTQHVAMNIADRGALYAEMRRVIRPGGRFALFDVVAGARGDVLLPVPWATEPDHNHLLTADHQRRLVEDAGFVVDVWDDPTQEILERLRSMPPAPASGTAPSPLSPRLFIDDLESKAARYLQNMDEARTALVLGACTAAW